MNPNRFNRYAVSETGADHTLLPEVELWTEVILQAMDDLHGTTAHLDHRSARAWFASDRTELGTFVWACQAINVDANFIRCRLVKT
jgi:hypothetical protein